MEAYAGSCNGIMTMLARNLPGKGCSNALQLPSQSYILSAKSFAVVSVKKHLLSALLPEVNEGRQMGYLHLAGRLDHPQW